jgi:hypothetical protein
MTHTDLLSAISRYGERQANFNANPAVVERNRAILRDFLHELVQDMHSHPDLFEDPRWDAPLAPSPDPEDPDPAGLIPRAIPLRKSLLGPITRCDDCPILHPGHNGIMPVCGVLEEVNGLSDRCILPGCPLPFHAAAQSTTPTSDPELLEVKRLCLLLLDNEKSLMRRLRAIVGGGEA